VDELASELSKTSATDPGVAALYIDLDRFKLINDEHSHALGDDVLCTVAQKLADMVRPGDHVGRLGGDEFLMILSDVGRPDDAFAIALRLENEIEEVSTLWPDGIAVAGSVGVAIARPKEGTGELLGRADAKMYERKADRRSQRETGAQGGQFRIGAR
ncbi:MAG: GGDEF domain-containing protein, partial [Acidimicrobiales bacterium]